MVIKIIILTAVLIRVLSQALPGDAIYFIGRDWFDFLVMIALVSFTAGLLRSFLSFMTGIAFYNLIEPVFTDPTVFDIREYIGFTIGLIFFLIQLIYGRYSKRVRQ